MSSAGSTRVLHFLSWAGRSGAERLVLNLCKATHDLAPAVWFPRAGLMVQEFRAAGIPCLSTEEVLGRPHQIRKDFGLLHIHCGTFEPVAHRTARGLGIPVVTTLHSHLSLPEIEGPLVCVAAHTAAIQDQFNRVVVIPNAVDTAEFCPGAGRDSGRIVIVRVCRPGRCAAWFGDAMRQVLDRCPSAELWIVGEEGHSEARVRYMGVRADVADLLRQADIFAYAPFPEEGSHDLCALEAIASGLPVVATDVNAVRGTVRSGMDGLLVPFGEVSAFADAVASIVEDVELRRRLGATARAHALENFTLERLSAQYRKVYAQARNAPPSAPADVIRRDIRIFVANRMRRATFEANLMLLNDTFARTDLANRFWVIGGLLIGWAREGKVLDHDCQDADFGILRANTPALLTAVGDLRKAGFEPAARYLDNRGVPVEYSFRKDGARFDFFVHEREGNSIRCTFFGLSHGPDPRPIEMISELPAYGLEAFEFLGRVWLKPKDHASMLTAEYGDWKTPRPGFDHCRDDRSVVIVNWCRKAARIDCDFSMEKGQPQAPPGREPNLFSL